MFVLKAKNRNKGESLETLRKEGVVPAVFYGMGNNTTSISVPFIEFKKTWREAGESSAVKLTLEGKDIDVLIHEVQVDPVSDEPIHVDFLVIDMNKKIEVSVPLEFVGVSNAVKNGLGNLVKVLHEIEVEALPKDLPQKIEVDISKLETVDDQISVSDLVLPQGVTVITNGEDIVASIVLQVEEKEEEVAPIDLSSIEVEKKGKKEEEGAGGDEGSAEGEVKSE